MPRLRFRTSEWVLIAFFAYVALLIPWFPDRPRLHFYPLVLFICTLALIGAFAYGEKARIARAIPYVRDWLPLGLTLVAFREMELFVPKRFNSHFEHVWIGWDYQLLITWHLRTAIEALGKVIPFYLELCYLLVYGVGAYCIIVLYVRKKRACVDRFFTIYLSGTLLAYALFPYFPSQPPRIAFPSVAAPHMATWIRTVNVAILNAATIHAGVFPSAHVSSVFSAAWAMFLLAAKRKGIGCGLIFYGICVAIATIYGRYHYAADVFAGFAVSLVAGAVAIVLHMRQRATQAVSSGITKC